MVDNKIGKKSGCEIGARSASLFVAFIEEAIIDGADKLDRDKRKVGSLQIPVDSFSEPLAVIRWRSKP